MARTQRRRSGGRTRWIAQALTPDSQEPTGTFDRKAVFIRHGESVQVVQARPDHASASETLETYSHLWRDSEEQARDAVDRVLRGARGTT